MNILSIETSCDETGVAILECSGDIKKPDIKVLGDALLSQVMQHREYGGVYPNLAKRLHAKNLVPILTEALRKADLLQEGSSSYDTDALEPDRLGQTLEREPELSKHLKTFLNAYEKPDIDALAVTQGPGLEPALWVGINFAKALSIVWDIPIVAVNHMEGHILSVLLGSTTPPSLPALALLISGGHTQLVLARDWGTYEILGQTRDDAVGEAFDKIARILDLPYPGGPEISKLAETARQNNLESDITLPRPMIETDDLDFSFSGLKTAALYLVKGMGTLTDTDKQAIARETEDAIRDVLITKTKKALAVHQSQALIVAGGVIANTTLRNAFETLAKETGVELYIPSRELSTDNAIMIGIAGYRKAQRKEFIEQNNLIANGNLSLANEQPT